MLELQDVDLSLLCEALEDHTYEHQWWLDPKTGSVELQSEYSEDEGEPDPQEAGWIAIDAIDSREAYEDMVEFIGRVRDPRARTCSSARSRAVAPFGASRTLCSSFPSCERSGSASTTREWNAAQSSGSPINA